MAAEVSSLVRLLSGYNDDRKVGSEPGGAKSTTLITRDLLGGGGGGGGGGGDSAESESQELDLDLQVPSGWEKRLDLKSGKVYLQRCSSSSSPSSSSDHRNQTNQTVAKLQDLDFPPSPSKITLNLFDEGSLELNLVSSPLSSNYQSVCTLDRVKSALERAEKEPGRKQSLFALEIITVAALFVVVVFSKRYSRGRKRREASSGVPGGGRMSRLLILRFNNEK
ncbi:hypothetical protein OIU84_006245 [Salix udensis]|uniref:Uncharacterized protein n=1 Tax=Salix udensis TaxID=889485 RepID=A0AAD6JZN0_9ROSI|nr:hypothetical protein OIU84_006245 [Salix udensis]